MLSSLNSSSETFLTNLNRISVQMSRAQKQISTGLRVASVSDEPDQVSTILQARVDLEFATQTQANLGRVKSEVDAAEVALQNAVNLVERARTLGSQGVGSLTDAQSRATLAGELGAILEAIGGLTRTTVEGRYIFSGDTDQQPPYTIDLAQPGVISPYSGGPSTREIQHPNGTRFAIAKTAQDIFDSSNPSENVLISINNLRVALEADDTDAIKTSLQDVISANTYLNGELSFYGTVQNRVAEATEFGAKLQLQLKTHISTLQDTDLTEAILELKQAEVQQQAALQSRASIPNHSLFDFLG